LRGSSLDLRLPCHISPSFFAEASSSRAGAGANEPGAGGKATMKKSKAVETLKNLRRQYPKAPKNELTWHLTALAKSDPELVESLSQILADALCDDDEREEQPPFRKSS
jgi:hypothetical protein